MRFAFLGALLFFSFSTEPLSSCFFFVVAVAIAFEDEDRHADGSSRRVMSWPKSVFCCLFFCDRHRIDGVVVPVSSINTEIDTLIGYRPRLNARKHPPISDVDSFFVVVVVVDVFFSCISSKMI